MNMSFDHRIKLVVDHSRVAEQTLEQFPVFVDIQDDRLKSVTKGDRVGDVGEIYFVGADETVWPHEIASYDLSSGSLQVWVAVPSLSHTQDTAFFLCVGKPDEKIQKRVWDDAHLLVHQTDHAFALSKTPVVTPALTVEAWVYSDKMAPDTFQVLTDAWPLRSGMDAFDSYDARHTDGLDTTGYFGSVCDGRYVYFAPQRNGSGKQHGHVLRLDTHGDFHNPNSWAAYDAGFTSGLNTKGYYGAVHAGNYIYFVPRTDGNTHHSRILRYDIQKDFHTATSWQAYDIGHIVSYQSAAYDGRYIYLTPGYEGDGAESGRAVRVDTHGEFADPASYVTYDAGNTNGLNTRNYDGACFDGRFVYYAPLNNRGMALRYDTQKNFDDPNGWQAYDASALGLSMCVGAIFDGQYVYYVPYAHSKAVRFDVQQDFQHAKSWQVYDASDTSGLYTKGYDGACFDGRYIYFIPFYEGDQPTRGFHCRLLRYDTQKAFEAVSAWEAADGGAFTNPPNPGGFNGGAFDGRYIYFAPWREDPAPEDDRPYTPHGKVLRYDTATPHASFILKYVECGHNGGLCASLPGPTFTLHTSLGTRSVRANRALNAGWHHIAGVYDGEHIALYIDGLRVSHVPASGTVTLDSYVSIGKLLNGGAAFLGRIFQVRVSSVARSEAWIKTTVQNLKNPARFVSVEG